MSPSGFASQSMTMRILAAAERAACGIGFAGGREDGERADLSPAGVVDEHGIKLGFDHGPRRQLWSDADGGEPQRGRVGRRGLGDEDVFVFALGEVGIALADTDAQGLRVVAVAPAGDGDATGDA